MIDLKSIIYKALFICMIILFLMSLTNIKVIDEIVNISVIPIFIINIIIMNSISIEIQKKSEEIKQYHKNFENDMSITIRQREEHIKKEKIYDKIEKFFEIKFMRILSWILVVLIEAYVMMIIFIDYCYSFFSRFEFNTISILSSILLILDICYREKISNKLIRITYKVINSRNKS